MPRTHSDNLPTRQDILDFVKTKGGTIGKREIARAFQIKGSDRIYLKRILRELEAEGLLNIERKKIHPASALPPVCVVQIIGQDEDGNFLAHAMRETQPNPAPLIYVSDAIRRGRMHKHISLKQGDRLLVRLIQNPDMHYSARIIRILNKTMQTLIGVVRIRASGAYLVSANRRDRHDYKLIKGDINIKDGDVISAIQQEETRYGERVAQPVKYVGTQNDPFCFSLIALAEQDIDTVFSEASLAEANAAALTDIDARTDLSHLPFVTIDPATARDHDDAVYAAPQKDGWTLYVAIADVAAFVPENSAMDTDAQKRGNSVYLPDCVVPMLPEHISTDICSLREHEMRAVLVCQIDIDKKGVRRQHMFYRAMIKSQAKLTYQQAQAAFDGTPDAQTMPLMESCLIPLWQVYCAMAKARNARAPLVLNRPERKVDMDETGTIKHIYIPESLEAHKLIEEFMIAANICAAETLEAHAMTLLYRIHGQPERERIRDLAHFLQGFSLKLNLDQPKTPHVFNKILEQGEKINQTDIIAEAVLRTQMQAEYNTENIGHFGLNLTRYTHFTSPIRRYADLLIHRTLIRVLGLGEGGISDAALQNLPHIAAHISQTERTAMRAERAALDRYLSAYMHTHIGAVFDGKISGLSRAGLFVRLNETGAEGFLPVSHLGTEHFFADKSKFTLTGAQSGKTFHIGMPIRVTVKEAFPLKGGLIFTPAAHKLTPKQLRRKKHYKRKH